MASASDKQGIGAEESTDQSGSGKPGCPICAFIEAGPCKEQHQSWVACREEAKSQGSDYVEVCSDTFATFLRCTLQHEDYYEPFLAMLDGIRDGKDDGGGGEGTSGLVSAGDDAGPAGGETTQPQTSKGTSS